MFVSLEDIIKKIGAKNIVALHSSSGLLPSKLPVRNALETHLKKSAYDELFPASALRRIRLGPIGDSYGKFTRSITLYFATEDLAFDLEADERDTLAEIIPSRLRGLFREAAAVIG